jgi:2-hydroxymuconate-semialdehyde hydrolase
MNEPQVNPEIGQTIRANGIVTNYLIEGSGAPVILLHGSGPGVTGYANWRTVLPRLSGEFMVAAPDIVGFGYTNRPPGYSYTTDTWIAHVVGFMDALQIGKAHFIGNSFGGALALAIAARLPDRVNKLVLMGSAGLRFEVTEGLDAVWGYEPSVAAMTQLMDYFAHDRGLVTPAIIESRYQASIRPGYQETFSTMFAKPRQAKLDSLATPPDQIKQVRNKTLIVHGREDRVVPLSVAIQMHQLLPESDLHVFGHCGHWTQIEKNTEFCRLVHDFLGDAD